MLISKTADSADENLRLIGKYLEDSRSLFPSNKVEYQKRQGREPHVRILKFSDDQILDFFTHYPNAIISEAIDKKYSGRYKPVFVETVPFILSNPQFRITKKIIDQKQLTPKKLGIVGEYRKEESFLKDFDIGIASFNPTLKNYLKSLLKDELIPAQIEFVEVHANDLKDFAEIYSAYKILLRDGFVKIPENESESFYDLLTSNNGQEVLYNVKHGAGSGQSLKSISSKINAITEKTVCVEVLKKLANCKSGYGASTVLEISEYLSNNDTSDLGNIMKLISKKLFGGTICQKNYNPPTDFSGYKTILEDIFDQLKLKKIGIAKKDTFGSLKGKFNNIIFSLATIIANYFNQEELTIILKKIVEVRIIHTDTKNGLMTFDEYAPNNVSYRLAYWGNVNAPTNNFIGFRSILK